MDGVERFSAYRYFDAEVVGVDDGGAFGEAIFLAVSFAPPARDVCLHTILTMMRVSLSGASNGPISQYSKLGSEAAGEPAVPLG